MGTPSFMRVTSSRIMNGVTRCMKKKMIAMVHCLQVWQHYLLGKPFVVKTDNVATSYFVSQPKLSPK